MSNLHYILIIVVASLLLFAFVWPQAVNKGVDITNLQLSRLTEFKLQHIPTKPFVLGLDLLGGAHLLYEADLSKIDSAERTNAMEGVRDVIERRVNFFGVSEPIVLVSGGDRLIIELAGIKDVNQAIKMIGETPFLEFKEQAPNAGEIIDEYNKDREAGILTELDAFLLQDQIFISTGL